MLEKTTHNKEKVLFFDTGPIISLVMSRMIWILPELKKQYGGRFYITPAVRRELVERPINVRRFKFEALQVMKLIDEGVLEFYENVPQHFSDKLVRIANSAFSTNRKNIDIIQSGEIESLACALEVGADAVVMDERTLRLLVENSGEMASLLERRFKKQVFSNIDKLKQFAEEIGPVKFIRSIELVAVAYKMGLFDKYKPKLRNGKRILVDSILWAVKYNGCAVTDFEVESLEEVLLSER